jgi:thermostable 8-oxoguanine DNA glycosylase
MITPTTITNYNRTEAELEEFLLFAILVAGKKAEMQAKKLDSFLFQSGLCNMTPFEAIEHLLKLGESRYYTIGNNPLVICMKSHKLGQYKRLYNAFKGILDFKGRLSKVTIDELESVYGVGSKTTRFFVLHSRPNAQVACLDTHILKWMDGQGYKNIPKATPPKKKYAEIEKLFLQEAIRHQMTPADLDLTIWKSYATKT